MLFMEFPECDDRGLRDVVGPTLTRTGAEELQRIVGAMKRQLLPAPQAAPDFATQLHAKLRKKLQNEPCLFSPGDGLFFFTDYVLVVTMEPPDEDLKARVRAMRRRACFLWPDGEFNLAATGVLSVGRAPGPVPPSKAVVDEFVRAWRRPRTGKLLKMRP